MSVVRIPLPSDDIKSIADTLDANLSRITAELGPDTTFHGIRPSAKNCVIFQMELTTA